MKRYTELFTLMCWVLAAGSVSAEDFFIAQSTSGSDSGVDCADAHSVDWFNAKAYDSPYAPGANWGTGPGQIGPGTTVHLCGTISTGLVVQGSGLQGNPITLYFEPNAKLSAPVMPIWINAYGQNWITIDGGQNGIIEETDNGTALGHQADSWGIYDGNNYGPNGNGITVKNLTIRNLYVRTPHTDDPHQCGTGMYLGGSNVTISNVTVTQTMTGIMFLIGASMNNLTVDASTVTAFNHGIEIGGGAGTSLSHVTLTNNYLDGFDVWEQLDPVPDLGFHRDPIFFHTDGSVSNIIISHNRIGPGFNPQTTSAGTDAIFFDGNNNLFGTYIDVYIFNNIFTLRTPLGWSDGAAGISGSGLFANNTLVGSGGSMGTGVGAANAYNYNNVMYNSAVATGIIDNPTGTNLIDSTEFEDYNIYPTNADPNFAYSTAFLVIPTSGSPYFGNNIYNGFSDWQARTAWDHHSIVADPLFVNPSPVNGDYHLTLGSPAIGAGINLTSFCSDAPALCTDFEGKSRPTVGSWDIGAYQFSSAAAPSSPVSPGILIQPQSQSVALGQTVTLNVVATGFPVPAYQWKKGGADISGATGASYTIPSAAVGDANTYVCVVSNTAGSVTSAPAILTVEESIATPTPTPTPTGTPTPVVTPTETKFLLFKDVFNPTKEPLTIKYTLNGNDATLKIYDRQGNEVKVLDAGTSGQTIWDGRNNQGSIVASGTYILALKQGGTTVKKEVVVVK